MSCHMSNTIPSTQALPFVSPRSCSAHPEAEKPSKHELVHTHKLQKWTSSWRARPRPRSATRAASSRLSACLGVPVGLVPRLSLLCQSVLGIAFCVEHQRPPHAPFVIRERIGLCPFHTNVIRKQSLIGTRPRLHRGLQHRIVVGLQEGHEIGLVVRPPPHVFVLIKIAVLPRCVPLGAGFRWL